MGVAEAVSVSPCQLAQFSSSYVSCISCSGAGQMKWMRQPPPCALAKDMKKHAGQTFFVHLSGKPSISLADVANIKEMAQAVVPFTAAASTGVVWIGSTVYVPQEVAGLYIVMTLHQPKTISTFCDSLRRSVKEKFTGWNVDGVGVMTQLHQRLFQWGDVTAT